MPNERPLYIYRPATIEFTLRLFDIGCHYSDRPLPIEWSVRKQDNNLIEIVGTLKGLEIEESVVLSLEGAGLYLFESAYTVAEQLERRMRATYGGNRNE